MDRLSNSGPLLLAIAYLGFISLGLPDTLIGVAWPSVRETFGLSHVSLAVIFFGTGLSYFFSSLFTGKWLRLVGTGALLAGSTALVALGMGGYAVAPAWTLFAVFTILHGLGSGAIDAGLNHYAAHHFSARHMNWLHACYSLGATGGSLLMATVVALEMPWRQGYGMIGFALGALALTFLLTRNQWSDGDSPAGEGHPAGTGMLDALRDPTVRLQATLFFFYTGLEVTVGQWSYTLLTESRGLSHSLAGAAVTGYWASIFVGRLIFGGVVSRVGIDRFLRWSTGVALAGVAGVALDISTAVSFAALVLTGLALATIYPCLMTRTPQRLGAALASHAIGFQVSAAMLGAAALPSLTGWIAGWNGLPSIAWTAAGIAFAVVLLHERLLRKDRAAPL